MIPACCRVILDASLWILVEDPVFSGDEAGGGQAATSISMLQAVNLTNTPKLVGLMRSFANILKVH